MLARRTVLATALGAVASLACGTQGDAPARADVVVVCTDVPPASLNPFVTPDQVAVDLLPLLYTPLVRRGDDGIEPGAATSWEWSEDATRVTFRLRDDLSWHDGEPVTAGDVVWTIRTAADPEFAYWAGGDFQSLASAEATDEGTVVVAFDAPYVAGLEPFSVLPILPEHLLGEQPAASFARASYHREPVGSGPYMFAGRAADGSLTFRRADAGATAPGAGAGPERVLFRFIPETSTQLIELETGGADLCLMGGSALDDAEKSANLEAMAVGPVGVQVIPLSNDVAPFDDVRVRRAFSAALDRQSLASVLSPVARPAGTFMPSGNPFRDPELLQPDDDPELAGALLDSAGWMLREGSAIRRDATGDALEFTVIAPNGAQNIMTAVQSQLRRAGMDARLEFMEGASFVEAIQDPDNRPAAMALIFTPERVTTFDPFAELHSEGFANLAGYANPEVDALVEALGRTTDPDERAALYHGLQREIARDVPTVYTVYIPRALAVGPGVEGVRVTAAGPFGAIRDWVVR